MANSNDNKISIDNNSGIVANTISGDVHYNYQPQGIKHSILAKILNELISSDFDFDNGGQLDVPYNVDEKISYNNVIKYKECISNYYTYSKFCEETINAMDNINVGTKNKILKFVHDKYVLAKGVYLLQQNNLRLSEIEIIRINSDNIIDFVKNELDNVAQKSDEIQKYDMEDYDRNLLAFIVYCFVECKILEKPLGANK